MKTSIQKRIAVAGAILTLSVFAAANAHLLVRAFSSQPACVVVKDAGKVAMHAC
ncbi:MAG: hypothetical protein KDJ90_02435 [Nitratireductor sp.]|nr:hypothetical protein [Nitratireductor sp.]